MTGTAKTTRNRACACELECGYRGRFSRSVLARGLATCPCGGTLVPVALEDAMSAHAAGFLTDAQLDAHPEWCAYVRELERIGRGRGGSQLNRLVAGTPNAKTRDGRMTADELAADRVYRERARAMYANRLAALEPHRFGATEPDVIPF